MPRLPRAVAELLAGYTPAVQAVAKRTRALVRAALPAAQEQVDSADHLLAYGYGLKMKDLICAIMPLKAGVNLLFSNGVQLPDPAGLLRGTGKHARHVRLSAPADVDNPALLALLQASAAHHAAANAN